MIPTSPTDVRDTLLPAQLSYGALPPCASEKSAPAHRRCLRVRASLGFAPPLVGEVDWTSMGVIYLITIISEASRGLLLPSAWPYFRSLGGSKALLGVFVGMLSYGRMMTTIPLGYLSDSGSMGRVFYVTSIVQIFGHALYVLAPSVTGLVIARLIIGFGSSTLSVCQAYIARCVPVADRTVHFAYLSALQFGAFALLPAVGGMFSFVPSTTVLGVALNGFTYPAALLVLCNSFVLAAVYTVFINPPQKAPGAGTEMKESPDVAVESTGEAEKAVRTVDYLPMLTCALSNIVLRGAIATLETVATPFLMEQFGMTYDSTGVYMTAFGVFGLCVFAGFKPIACRMSDRFLVAIGLITTSIAALPLSISRVGQNLPVVLYAAFLGLIWSVGYPVGQTGALSLFSKTTQGLPAGGLLGIYSASGSLSRVLFAIAVGVLWGWLGRESVFAVLLIFSTATLALIGVVWRKLRLAI